MRCILAFLFILILGGCTSAQTITTRTPLYKYRADLDLSASGKSVRGLISIPRSEPTKIEINSPVKMDLVRISSCNRDWTVEKVGGSGWWNQTGTQYAIDYSPNAVEHEGFCPLYIQVFDSKVLTSWGFVAFRTTENLKADVSCDGAQYRALGVDSCQSFIGMEQGLAFEKPVKYEFEGPCDVRRKDEKTLRVRTTGLGFCRVSVYDGLEFFHFILLGYDEILIRGRAEPIKGGGW